MLGVALGVLADRIGMLGVALGVLADRIGMLGVALGVAGGVGLPKGAVGVGASRARSAVTAFTAV